MILGISASNVNSNTVKNAKSKQDIRFKGLNYKKALKIEQNLSQKGISADFSGNAYIAEATQRIVDIFERLFGHSSLPKQIKYMPLDAGTLGSYYPNLRLVAFNSNMNITNNESALACEQKFRKLTFPKEFSSYHPAATFVHEFGHSAHHQHLNHLYGSGGKVMDSLSKARVPTALGTIMTGLGLSTYALDTSGGLCEFMAEKISKDVCDSLYGNEWNLSNDIDVKYSDIFDRKWEGFKFASHQSFFDYVSQQVWDGKIKKENIPLLNTEEILLEEPALSASGKIHEEMINVFFGPADTAIRLAEAAWKKLFR